MNEEKYYLICGSEDGDATMWEATIDDINEDASEAAENGYMHKYYQDLPNGDFKYVDLCNINGRIIIKGKIVCPKPKEVVKEWEIE